MFYSCRYFSFDCIRFNDLCLRYLPCPFNMGLLGFSVKIFNMFKINTIENQSLSLHLFKMVWIHYKN